MKNCSKCGVTKDSTEFHKKTKSADGLQGYCKSCIKDTNTNFRITKPEYQTNWVKRNSAKWTKYVADWRRADKTPTIYSITSPDGLIYIGMTLMPLSARIREHRRHYKSKTQKPLPLLHKSFDDYGFDNHKVDVVIQFPDMDRKQVGMIENLFIKSFQLEGKSLNIRNK
jgi:hypothetical protein